jgi:Transmembrane secretion effector
MDGLGDQLRSIPLGGSYPPGRGSSAPRRQDAGQGHRRRQLNPVGQRLPDGHEANRGGRLGPLAETQFRRLYLARALSLFGDALVPVALAFGVLAVDRSPSAFGLVLASRFASLVVFLLIAGVIADRLPRKGILVGSDLVRLAAQSITASILVTSTATVWELVLLAFVYGAGEAFFRPTSTGFVPETISRARLQQANALLAATTSACTVLGPVLQASWWPRWAREGDRGRRVHLLPERDVPSPDPDGTPARTSEDDVCS